MINTRIFKHVYKKEKDADVKLVNMKPDALVGYYLEKYPGDPVRALDIDMKNLVISTKSGLQAKALLKIVMGEI